MVELSIDQSDLQVDVRGWSKLWAFKRRLRVPLSQIRAVRREPTAAKGWWKGWRMPGTHIPGVIVAEPSAVVAVANSGTSGAGRNAMTIELAGGKYRRLVMDVADPDDAVRKITALGRLAA